MSAKLFIVQGRCGSGRSEVMAARMRRLAEELVREPGRVQSREQR